MALLIQNGEIITADKRTKVDLYIEDETITEIRRKPERSGRYRGHRRYGQVCLPRFYRPARTHLSAVYGALTPRTRTKPARRRRLSAASTTFIEMCAPAGSEDALEGYKHWKTLAEGNAACDYTPFTWA